MRSTILVSPSLSLALSARAEERPLSALPYTSGLHVAAMDREAFACKVGQPMAPGKTCRVW